MAGRMGEKPGLVPLRDDVVAHLVAAKNREEWEAEEQGPKADRLGGQDWCSGIIGPVPRSAEEHGREDRHGEQPQVHLPPRESSLETALNMQERLALLLRHGL